MQINGAAARLVHTGDTVIVMSYAQYESNELLRHRPIVIELGERDPSATPNTTVRVLTHAG
jgi:aspartate 1-decarboxylase